MSPVLAGAALLWSAVHAETSIAVMAIDASPDERALATQVTARVAYVVDRRPGTRVIAPDDIRAMLLQEQQRQLLGCTDEGCLTEIAGALGADLLIAGRLTRLDRAWSLSLSILDSSQVESKGRASELWGGPAEGLLELVEPMVSTLFEAGGGGPGAVALTGAAQGSEVFVDDVPRGKTPMGTIRQVPPGGRKIVLNHPGLKAFEAWVVVRPGAQSRVVVKQEALEDKVTEKWWFWSLIAAGVAGGAATVVLLAQGSDGGDPQPSGVQVGVNVGDAVMGGRP